MRLHWRIRADGTYVWAVTAARTRCPLKCRWMCVAALRSVSARSSVSLDRESIITWSAINRHDSEHTFSCRRVIWMPRTREVAAIARAWRLGSSSSRRTAPSVLVVWAPTQPESSDQGWYTDVELKGPGQGSKIRARWQWSKIDGGFLCRLMELPFPLTAAAHGASSDWSRPSKCYLSRVLIGRTLQLGGRRY